MVMRETPSQRAALAWLPLRQLDGAAEQFLLGEFHHASVDIHCLASLGGGQQIVNVFSQWPVGGIGRARSLLRRRAHMVQR